MRGVDCHRADFHTVLFFFVLVFFHAAQGGVSLYVYPVCDLNDRLAFDKHFHVAFRVSYCKILKLDSFFSFQKAKVLLNVFTGCFVPCGHSSDSSRTHFLCIAIQNKVSAQEAIGWVA